MSVLHYEALDDVDTVAAYLRSRRRVINGQLAVNLAERTIEWSGGRVALPPSEWTLAARMSRDPWRVFTVAELMDWLPGSNKRALNAHVSRTRLRVSRAGGPGHILYPVSYRIGWSLLAPPGTE